MQVRDRTSTCTDHRTLQALQSDDLVVYMTSDGELRADWIEGFRTNCGDGSVTVLLRRGSVALRDIIIRRRRLAWSGFPDGEVDFRTWHDYAYR